MPNSILLLLFCASAGHAVWNALSRKVSQRDKFFTMILITAIIFYCPIAIHLSMTTLFPKQAVKWLISSTIFEVAYFICLAKAYRVGSFLTVYPVARGSAPLLITAFSFILTKKFVGHTVMIGIVLVVTGIVFINQQRFSISELGYTITSKGSAWALLTGICTAGYSICDSIGASMMSPILFKYTVFVGLCVGKLSVDFIQTGQLSYFSLLKRYPYHIMIGGILVFGVNAAVVYSMKSVPVALVATIREMSIVFASIIGLIWLKEPMNRTKMMSIVLILAGVLLIRE